MSSSFPPNQAREGTTAQAVAPGPGPEKAVRVPDGFGALAKLPGVVIYQRLVTPDGQIRYTYISEGARELFGVSAEEIISDPKALFSCHSADYSAKFKERLLAASKSLTSWDVEASIVSRDGRLLVNEHRTEEGTVVLYTDISELKRREREIRHLAYHDVLTNLPNRMLFQERIEEALNRARERNTTAALMCLDLDNFKYVNDTLGHSPGDDLLKCLSTRLRSCLRDSDTIARLGGDEFGIVITDLQDAEYATSLAWRLSDAVNQPIDLNGQRVNMSVSIGIATSSNGDTTSDRLLKDADLALYRAKADGRATFRFFEAEMDARAQERRLLEMDLRHAVAKDQLELHYQAQVDIFSSEITGFEALVRWNRPGQGLVSPAHFIPLAEETGIIMSLGEWVLRKACKDAVGWPSPVRVAVNVSAAQFKDRNL